MCGVVREREVWMNVALLRQWLDEKHTSRMIENAAPLYLLVVHNFLFHQFLIVGAYFIIPHSHPASARLHSLLTKPTRHLLHAPLNRYTTPYSYL